MNRYFWMLIGRDIPGWWDAPLYLAAGFIFQTVAEKVNV